MRPLLPFLDADKARDAFEAFVLPGIQNAIKEEHVKRLHLHVVAFNSLAMYDPTVDYGEYQNLPILFDYSVGDPAAWEWDYNLYVQGKALITLRTGLSSRDVLMTKPQLLMPGDPLYWGSAIIDGVIVGVSGVEPHFDEMFARMTAAALCAEATHYAEALKAQKEAPDFIPLGR